MPHQKSTPWLWWTCWNIWNLVPKRPHLVDQRDVEIFVQFVKTIQKSKNDLNFYYIHVIKDEILMKKKHPKAQKCGFLLNFLPWLWLPLVFSEIHSSQTKKVTVIPVANVGSLTASS